MTGQDATASRFHDAARRAFSGRARMLPACLLSLVLGTALPAAAGTFRPPAGCEPYVTVQQRSCRVSNHFRCAEDAPGDQWRVDFGINGAYFRSRIDREAQWVESHESDGTVDLLQPDPADPASFSELLATGRDTFQFTTQKSNGLRENITGYDQLTGETAVIDGVALKRTKYDVRATDDDGGVIWQARGSEYIHPQWRIFLSGAGQVNLGEGFLPQDFSPVEFVMPGEAGFFTTIPLYDCDATVAGAPGPMRRPVAFDPQSPAQGRAPGLPEAAP